MEDQSTAVAEKKQKPLEVFRTTLTSQRGEFEKVLPSHISFEKFQRTVMTAIITQPDLLAADRQSLLVSCLKAATDGLLPDNRDAALVVFNSKGKDQSGRDVWLKKIQYMPMYAGILKKVRQSGDLASIVTHVVYEKDKFEYVLGDDERIVHEPHIGKEDRGEIIAAYCIAKLKDGTVVREVMSRQDIEKVRRSSKSGSMNENDLKYNKGAKIGDPKGIWLAWYEEMARKTVFRRAAKWLPQQIELVERLFENDQSMKVIDQVRADDPLMIEGTSEEVIDEGPAQPDLKESVEKKKAAGKKAEKKEPKKSKEKQQEGENSPRETIIETPDEKPEETPFQRIKRLVETADSGDDLYHTWTKDVAEEYNAIKKADPQQASELFEIYKTASKKFEEE